VAGDVNDGEIVAGAEIRFEIGQRELLVGQQLALHGAVRCGIGGIVNHGVELGNDAGKGGKPL
jgi:hypothetical protein